MIATTRNGSFVVQFEDRGSVSFRAYKVIHEEGGIPHFESVGALTPMDDCIAGTPTRECEVFLSGTLRPDGCMNFEFPDSLGAMLHTCTRADVAEIGALLLYVRDHGAEMFGSNWSGQ